MATGDGVMPNGRNSMGGRKPAMPASDTGKGYGKNPPAGAPKNADLTAGYSEPKPSQDTGSAPAIPGRMGTHMGSTVHMPGDPLPKRRNIKTDAK